MHFKEEITLNSIVSYPERGDGGSNAYRGNCSPKLIEDIIDQYQLHSLSDYMMGSGTAADVCRAKNIPGRFLDLRYGFDMLSMDIPDRPENIFWHPPYHDIVVYSDGMYSAQEIVRKYGFDPRTHDLSRCRSWDDFTRKLDFCCLKQFTALEKGGRMFLLLGDIKRQRRLYSMLLNVAKPGTVEQVIIKAQHNCTSDSRRYSGHFVRIVHEYLLVLRKDSALVFDIQLPHTTKGDVRDMRHVTWRDIVAAVLEEANGPMALPEIYERIDGHRRCTGNPHWRDKIRQILHESPLFTAVSRGVYKYAG